MNTTVLLAPRLLLGGQRAVRIALAALVAAALVLSLFDIASAKRQTLQLLLTGIAVLFWWMLTGSRVLGFAFHARQLRIPRPLAHLPSTLLIGVMLSVPLPALLWAALGSDLPLSLAALALAAGMGLFFAVMPPWLVFALLGAGLLARVLPVPALALQPPSPTAGMALAGAALATISALLWARLFRHGMPARAWSVPIALSLQAALGESPADQPARQQQAGLMHLLQGTRIPAGLAREPDTALALALGPGFGAGWRALLLENAWLLGVALSWLLLYSGEELRGGNLVALAFPALMVAFSAAMPALRLWTLYHRPALGLHELALLPGLARPGGHADALARALTRRQLMSLLASLALMSAYGWLLGAPAPYHWALLWIGATSMMLAAWLALRRARQASVGVAGPLLIVGAGVAALATMSAVTGDRAPAWLMPAWCGACAVLALLRGLELAALKRLPHPFLAR